MPARIESGPPRRILIGCDTCHTEINDEQIALGNGLVEMGWLRRFNSETRNNEYFCPEHTPEKENPGGN